MTKIIESLIQAKAAQAPPLLKRIYTKTDLYKQCAHELQEDIERLKSDRLALLFAQYASITGQHSSEYKTRLISCDNGNIALCGIRFRGMDISQPFVTVTATLKPLSITSISVLVDNISKAFEGFKPQYIQFYVPSCLDIEPANFPLARWDNRILANSLDTLNENAGQDMAYCSNKKYELLSTNSLTFYNQYVMAYNKLLNDVPQHALMMELKPIEEMRIWVAHGFVHLLYVNDELAGVIIVEPDNSLGMTGFYIIENIIFSEHRGQGLGKWMQQAMIYHLANDQSRQSERPKTDMLFGTIHFDNTSAIQCAKSVGRYDIGGYLWVATGIK